MSEMAQAIAQSESGASEEFKEELRRAVLQAANENPDGFTGDDVWDLVEFGDYKPGNRVLGPVMLRLKQEGWITPTGEARRSRLDRCHHAWHGVWKLDA